LSLRQSYSFTGEIYMRRSLRYVLLGALLVGAVWATAQMGEIGAPTPGTTGIRVLAPKSGQQFGTNIVPVRFELTNPRGVAATSPSFSLQMDSTDPVTTATTEYTFTGLAAGSHQLTIQLIDANQTPVAGTQVVVPFTVAQQGAQSANPRSQMSPLNPPAYMPTSYLAMDDNDALPNSGSALPLLSVIGFGVLVGGIATAMKTR
jgi:hypothetical protein